MTDKKRVLAGLLISLAVLSVIGMGLGGVSGQILSEQTYYEEDFSGFNDTSANLAPDDDLRNSYLVNTDAWTHRHRGDTYSNYGIRYGDRSQHVTTFELDTSRPFLSAQTRGDNDHLRIGAKRTIDVPNGTSNPTLVVEHAHMDEGDSNFYDHEIAVNDRLLTTRAYDSDPGTRLASLFSDNSDSYYSKQGNLVNSRQMNWRTSLFDVQSGQDNVTLRTIANYNDGDNHRPAVFIRQIYWTNGGEFSEEIGGWQAIAEDDSFGGPDPYPLRVVTEPTANGKETKLRANGQTITREFSLDGFDDAQRGYFVLEGTSQSQHPVKYTVEAFGQEQASGSIDAESTSEETVELDLDTSDVTVTIQSKGQYDVNKVQFTALEETSQGDPLAKSNSPGGITLNPDKGYDSTIGLLITGLNITTDTLLYVVMIALIVGFMVFSYTKSVRGQEFAQSLLMGAIIAGVVVVGVVPTMNLATWIFTGGVERAPLADPALEAEPPTYYSTEFQDGTMHGWKFDNARGQGSVRPVSAGESFNLQFSGTGSTAGIITHQEHISLGNSLSTGFVNIDGAAESVAGYNTNPHEVTYNVRVYVTKDGELSDSEKIDPSTNFVENDQTARELRNPVTEIHRVTAKIDGETRDITSDFEIVDAASGTIRYTGNSTLANNASYSETLDNPEIRYETYNNGPTTENMGTMESGDTYEVGKSETSESIYAVSEIARSFNGETMSNEKLVTFDLDGQYVHTELIIRSNRDDENPVGTLSAVRVGATTESGSVEH